MAQFIPVNGEPEGEEPLSNLMPFLTGKLVGLLRVEPETTVAYLLEAQVLNEAATKLAGGQTVYGDAIIFRDTERFS